MKIKNLKIIDWREKEFKLARVEKDIERLSHLLVKILKKKKLFVASMESCTGGAFINALTNIEGASEVTKGARITYSNQEKITHGISEKVIKKYSVYSPQVAELMAKRIIRIIKGTKLGLGITGTFYRPDPMNLRAHLGEVYISLRFKNKSLDRKIFLPRGKRTLLKFLIVREALKLCLEILK